MKKIGKVIKVLTGTVQCYAQGSQSAIAKQTREERQSVTNVGFEHDEQGDLRYHGGVEKALHIYPSEHYPTWKKEIGEKVVLQSVGAFGENISSEGVTEDNICIGDKLCIGTTLVEVSQGRMPCWKLNYRFDQQDMALRLQQTSRTGWYFRVLRAGDIGGGDAIYLHERPYPDWTIAKVMEPIFSRCLDKKKLEELLSLPLVGSWRRLVEDRLRNNVIEDWGQRLYGKDNVR